MVPLTAAPSWEPVTKQASFLMLMSVVSGYSLSVIVIFVELSTSKVVAAAVKMFPVSIDKLDEFCARPW